MPEADVIVSPENAEETSAVLKIANYYKIPVTTWGGGGGMRIWTDKGVYADKRFANLDGEEKNGFSKAEYVFSSKEGAGRLDFYICAGSSSDSDASIWYDDIKVEETSADRN